MIHRLKDDLSIMAIKSDYPEKGAARKKVRYHAPEVTKYGSISSLTRTSHTDRCRDNNQTSYNHDRTPGIPCS